MRSIVNKLAISIALVFSVNSVAFATSTSVELNTTYQGRYIAHGGEVGVLNTNSNEIYIQQAIDIQNNIPYSDRNFFVFDFTGLNMANLQTAELFVNNSWNYSTESKIEFALYDVSTNIDALRNGSTSSYADLGTGVSYGSFVSNNPGRYDNYVIEFNQSGLDAAKTANGLFAIGGSFTTQVSSGQAWMFGNNENPTSPLSYGLRLTFSQSVTPVPEADNYAMLLAGLSMLGVAVRRRSK